MEIVVGKHVVTTIGMSVAATGYTHHMQTQESKHQNANSPPRCCS